MFCCSRTVDPHRSAMAQQQAAVPEYWDQFQGVNLPASHRHVVKSLSADNLTSLAQQLFNLLEQVNIYIYILKGGFSQRQLLQLKECEQCYSKRK